MPKRNSNSTGANVLKSDTTVKGSLSRGTSQQLIPVSFVTCSLPLRTPKTCEMIPYQHEYSLQQQMTRQKSLVYCGVQASIVSSIHASLTQTRMHTQVMIGVILQCRIKTVVSLNNQANGGYERDSRVHRVGRIE
jgi:hypothetical protein